MGLFALRLRESGFYTPHGMNDYTGPLFGLLLAGTFDKIPAGVYALRLPGALCNAAAALLLAGHFARRLGFGAAFAWLYLAATSTMFLWESRVAWEVCAFQNLLLAVILTQCRLYIEERRFPPWSVLLFLACLLAGTLNHFIFISVPLSLAALSTARLWLERDRESTGFWRACCAGLLLCAAAFAVKPRIGADFWRENAALLAAATALMPFLFTAAFLRIGGRWDALILNRFERAALSAGRARRAAKGLWLLGLAAFALFHAAPLVQIGSNVALFKRMMSWSPPWALSLPLYLWAAVLLGIYLHGALGALRDALPLSAYARFLLLWPLAYAPVFLLFRHTSSIRYYIIPSFLLMAGTAAALARLSWVRSPRAWAPGLAVAALLNALFWSELSAPQDRPPLEFRVGWRKERSADFLRKEALFRLMEREGICRLKNMDGFIDLPLHFHNSTRRPDCDPHKVLETRLCAECTEPPYFAWTIRHEPG